MQRRKHTAKLFRDEVIAELRQYKVREGGLVSGHDWLGRHGKDVQKAVMRYRKENELEGEPEFGSVFRNFRSLKISPPTWWWWKGGARMPKRKLTAREIKAINRQKKAEANAKVQAEKAMTEEERKIQFIDTLNLPPLFKQKVVVYSRVHSFEHIKRCMDLWANKKMAFAKAIRVANREVGK